MITKQLRDRLWHSLNPETANVVGLRVDQLQQCLLGGRTLSPEQTAALARYFGIAT
jgi:hypothetical protein